MMFIKMYKPLFFVFFQFVLLSTLFSQEMLLNPSFEGVPAVASMPDKWKACDNKTTPDILPGQLDVKLNPSDGNSFLGLITRDNGDREAISQKLQEQLKKQTCYEFTIDLARSDKYISYNIPLGLNIWIGSGPCSEEQLVLDVKSVDKLDWETYTVRFITEKKFEYIKIIPVQAPGIMFNYNGNVLLDNISSFKVCKRS